ncbi:hypothetical protein [Mesobacillus jeotgali]|uniref:hypothetical protein n=1 Tax=Mesobacillus jeotgali TaxID=129985 RepID=UPI0009A564C3|nr:hypothetical protein [Mesobacillus jeotgali]
MANTFDLINLNIMSLKDFQDAELATNVMEKISQYGKDFIPNKYGLYQPLKNKYDAKSIDNVVKLWMNEENNINNRENLYLAGQVLMEKKGGHKVSYQIRWEKDNQARFNFFNLSVETVYLKNEKNYEKFLNLCNDLILLLEPVHGEIVNLSFKGWDAPKNLTVRHPELNWMVFFGRPYIDLFGKESLITAPCCSVHTLNENIIGMQLTENLFNPIPSSVRSSVKKYLGEEAFVEEGKSYRRYSSGKVPDFDFSNVLFDKKKPVVEPQIRNK